MANFVVLRNAARVTTDSGFDGFGADISAALPAMPEPVVEVHDLSVGDALGIKRDPQVAAVAIPMPIALIVPFDTGVEATRTDAWGISAVKADTSPMTGNGVVVAVLDTGIDPNHPAFHGVTIIEKDFSGSGNGDKNGHGTHCAGTIFGRDVNRTRIGIARGVTKALIGKVLSDAGGGNSDMIFRGIQWAVNEGANVVSMSLGFDFPGAVERMIASGLPPRPAASRALEAYRSNLLFFNALMQMVRARSAFEVTPIIVAASGNESDRPNYSIAASLPAASDGVVSVAALQRELNGTLGIARFSNSMAEIAAPGVDIVSAKPGGGLRSLSGTSMACPHVAGVASLWWESLRRSSHVKPSAKLVMSNLLARARTDVVTESAAEVDRGVGIVTAPSGPLLT